MMIKVLYQNGSSHCGRLIWLCCLLVLSGCGEAIFAGAGLIGAASMEERSLGSNIDDKSISAEIHHRYIQNDINHLLTDVTIRVHEGRVLLVGRTPKERVAEQAATLAWQAAGVREVINEIKVIKKNSDFFNYASDNAVESQIEARLLATSDIHAINYTVEVVDGVAYLLGIAKDKQERQATADIASRIKGVDKVVSHVRLRSDPRRLKAQGLRPEAERSRRGDSRSTQRPRQGGEDAQK